MLTVLCGTVLHVMKHIRLKLVASKGFPTPCQPPVNPLLPARLHPHAPTPQPLYMGSPYDPVLLSKLYEAERNLKSPLKNLFTIRPKQPTLTFRVRPLHALAAAAGGAAAPPQLAHLAVAPLYALPVTMVAGVELACVCAAWRLALAQAITTANQQQHLSRQPPLPPSQLQRQQQAAQQRWEAQQRAAGCAAAAQRAVMNDAALGAFLGMCEGDGDEVIMDTFLDKWRAACKELRMREVRRVRCT